MIRFRNRAQFLWSVFPMLVLALAIRAKAADAMADNPELKQIYDADQNDREGPLGKSLDWDKITPRDAARRRRVRELIDQGRLNTEKDYERAAMVFQHGEGSEDILFAHVLAVTAIGKGDRDGRWLAAASLDRFLQRVARPQIFGTQFTSKMKDGQETWSMEPYNRTLIGSSLRQANCVPDQEQQVEMLKSLSKGEEPKSPAKRPCVEQPE